MISEKILVNPENKKIEDTITLTYDQRFIRRKKLVSDNNFGFLVNLSETVSLKKNDGFLLDNGSIILNLEYVSTSNLFWSDKITSSESLDTRDKTLFSKYVTS